MPRAYIANSNFTCSLNVFAARRAAYFVETQGWELTKNLEDADVVLYYGCAFDRFSEAKSLEEVRHILSAPNYKRGKPLVIVTGCLPEINEKTSRDGSSRPLGQLAQSSDNIYKVGAGLDAQDQLPGLLGLQARLSSFTPPADYRFANPALWLESFEAAHGADKAKVVKEMHAQFELAKKQLLESGEFFPVGSGGLAAYGYKRVLIGSGCQNNCSYCSIKFAKGEPRSYQPEKILSEVEELAKSGCDKVLILADDIGSWGVDLGMKWTDLIESLLALDARIEFAIHNLNAFDVVSGGDLLRRASKEKRLKYLGAMIQHVSPGVLRRMSRRVFDVSALESIVRDLHSGGTFVYSHLIAGFPGETEAEHHEMLEFLVRLSLGQTNFQVFPFQVRAGTPAQNMGGHLPLEDVLERAKAVRAVLSARLTTEAEDVALRLSEAHSAIYNSLETIYIKPGL